jgi:acetyl-CoA synthetase
MWESICQKHRIITQFSCVWAYIAVVPISAIGHHLHSQIAECAVAIEDKLKGQGFVLFYVSNSNQERSIKKNIVNTFGQFAIPKCIIKIQELPKTKSGKILRRLLRSLLINPDSNNIGDVSTMNNPKIIYDIIKNIGIKYDRIVI